jgi:hypothetical protein
VALSDLYQSVSCDEGPASLDPDDESFVSQCVDRFPHCPAVATSGSARRRAAAPRGAGCP